MSECHCNWCREYEEIKAVKERGDVEEMRRWIDRLSNDLWQTQEDLSHKRAILDGSWPEAERYAEHILSRVAARRLQEERG